ncbi:MAG: cupredoxin domain-containing protein [Actinomycetota bacterium]
MSTRLRLVVAVAVGVATVGGGYAIDDAAGDEPEAVLGPGLVTVTVDIEYSRFDADLRELHVRPGTTVEFVVRNHDPISHELIIGDEAVHAHHAVGQDIVHPPVPGEVSVGPGDTGVTYFEFDEPEEVRFACHLRGHVEYGMTGTVVVADS